MGVTPVSCYDNVRGGTPLFERLIFRLAERLSFLTAAELDALMPSILSKAFSGEL